MRPEEPIDSHLFAEPEPVRGQIRQILSPRGGNLVAVAATQLNNNGAVVEIPIKSEAANPGAADPLSRPGPDLERRAIVKLASSCAVTLSPSKRSSRRGGPHAPRTQWSPVPEVSLNSKDEVIKHKNADSTFHWKRLFESSSPPSITYECSDENCSAKRKYVLNRTTLQWRLFDSTIPHVDPHQEAYPEAKLEVNALIEDKLRATGGKTAQVSTFVSISALVLPPIALVLPL